MTHYHNSQQLLFSEDCTPPFELSPPEPAFGSLENFSPNIQFDPIDPLKDDVFTNFDDAFESDLLDPAELIAYDFACDSPPSSPGEVDNTPKQSPHVVKIEQSTPFVPVYTPVSQLFDPSMNYNPQGPSPQYQHINYVPQPVYAQVYQQPIQQNCQNTLRVSGQPQMLDPSKFNEDHYHFKILQEPGIATTFVAPSIVCQPDARLMKSLIEERNYLLTLSSREFNDFICHVEKYRAISPEEKEEKKQILKRIKNRESARRSRRDKKDKLEELTDKIKKLRTQMEGMKGEMAILRNENAFLKTEMEYSNQVIRSNPDLARVYETNRPKKNAQTQTTNNNNNNSTINFHPSGMAPLFLLVILFSFGLFLPISQISPSSGLGGALKNVEFERKMSRYLKEEGGALSAKAQQQLQELNASLRSNGDVVTNNQKSSVGINEPLGLSLKQARLDKLLL